MRRKLPLTLFAFTCMLLAAYACFSTVAAQSENTLRIASVGPYDKVVPGQIVELRVEGLGEPFISPPSGDELKVQVTQDGATHAAPVRGASFVIIPEAAPAGASPTMKQYQALTFVVPRGLHTGEAEVSVSYRKRQSAPARLNIVERPLQPLIGSMGITTIAPSSLPMPPKRGEPVSLGLRFERGARHVELHVKPLVDPKDPDAAVLIRFKQGGATFDVDARVIHREKKTESLNGGVRFTPTRDILEFDVPEQLSTGEAELEVRLRAGGQTGDAATVPVTITDATRAYEAPEKLAPRLLAVAPRRVGAGQAIMISVDHRRTLDPDPLKAVVVVEAQDGTRYTLKPEMNSVVHKRDATPDAPVLLIARTTEQIKGAATVRVVNPARAEAAGGVSEAVAVEIVDEVLPPEVISVAESSKAELAQLRQMYETQAVAGLPFPEYDPSRRYVTIRARGLDYNPKFQRIRMEQEGRAAATVSFADFSLFSNDALVVRVPKEFGAGIIRLSVENRGARGYSAPVVKTFELSSR